MLGVTCGCKLSETSHSSVANFEDYAWAKARVLPTNRRFSENLVWLWVYSFMLINVDADIACLRGSERQLPKQTILKMAVDLGQYLLSDVGQAEIEETSDGNHSPRSLVHQAWGCINIFAQLHAIGTGTEDLISNGDSKRLSLQADLGPSFSSVTAFLAGK